ncbi:hypothetical protein DFH06DRAFT_1129368 [Mycena polygramma]|nr:hypothetical protein DFH06DRAFT_1129368 [Mycena polygramma]
MTPRVAEHSEDLGAAESAESAGLIGIGGGIVGNGTGTEGQRTIRTDRTCGSWKAGKCREPGGNPEAKDRRDRRTTNEEGEDVERGRMMTEATGGQRLTLRHMVMREAEAFQSGRRAGNLGKVGDGEVHGHMEENSLRRVFRTGTKSRKQERCRMGYREGIREAEGEPDVPKWERRSRKPEYRPRRMEIDLKQVKVIRGRCWNRRPRPRHRGRKKGSGKKRDEDGKPPTSSGPDSGPRPRKPKPERELENCHIVEFGLGSETVQAGTGRKEGRWKETEELSQSLTKISEPSLPSANRAKPDSADSIRAEGQDRKWRTRIGEWNEKSRSLMDQCSILEARRFGVGVVATSARPKDLGQEQWTRNSETGGRENECKVVQVGSEVGSGEIREANGMEEAAKGMGNRNNEKGRNLREVHGEDPMGRTTRRKSSTCSETTTSDSASRRFGSEESEVRRYVRNRKSSAESVVRIRNPEVGSRIRSDKGESQRMTAQELLVQSESANNSSEEKSEIIGKARKFEMPIPPLRVDIPSSSARFQLLRGYWGMTRSFHPKSQRDRQVKGEKLKEPETRQQERSGCRSATRLMVDSSMRGSKGAEASDEVPEEPKHLTNQSREATGKTEANARMFGRVPMARAAEAEHDRKESPNGESPEGDDG